MNPTSTARTAGIVGAVGGAALVVLALLQLADRLGDSTGSTLSIIGMLCLAAVPLALLRTGAATTKVGRIGLILWAVGLVAIALAEITTVALDLEQDTNPLYPIGGLSQLVGGLMAGASIARAGSLAGWVRWAPLAWALAYAAMIPFGFTESTLSAVAFAVFGAVAAIASLGVAGAEVRGTDAELAAAPAH